MNRFNTIALGCFFVSAHALAEQALITTVDKNLSAVPVVYAADVAPGGILGYNEQTHEVFYEGRSAKAKTLLLAPDATFPFPKETVDKSRNVNLGLSFLGIDLSTGLSWTGKLEISGGEFTVHRFVPDPDALPKPFDALVYTDKETVDTAYDGYMKWRHWNAFLIEAVYKTKSLKISKSTSTGIKLSNGDTPPDCEKPTKDPKQNDTAGNGSEIKKDGTTKDVGNNAIDLKAAAKLVKQKTDGAPEKPDTDIKKDKKQASLTAVPKVSLQACFNSDRELVISSDQPAVSAVKLLELFPNDSKELGFDYRPTTTLF